MERGVLLISFMIDSDNEVGRSLCPVVPRVGETIWLMCTTEHARKNDLDNTQVSYTVTDVAYWMPNTDAGYNLECSRVAVFVKPIQ